MNKISILSIIVTYNGLKNNWIEKCLNSLLASSQKTDIIVIDNASTDETIKYIAEKFPSVETVKSNKNLGFGQANNMGLKKCLNENYNYAFLLNQDAWVEKDTIEKLIKISIQEPEFGILSPVHLNGKGNALDLNFSYHVAPQNCKHFYSDIFFNKIKLIYPLKFVNAAAWLLTKTCIEKVGGFSPTFYHYAEDDNYCHRTLWNKLKIGIVPESRIYHDRENREALTNEKQQWDAIIRGFNLYYSDRKSVV